MGTHSNYQVGFVYRTDSFELVVTLLWVRKREEGVVALHLPIRPLKNRSGLEPVQGCEPSTYHPISG